MNRQQQSEPTFRALLLQVAANALSSSITPHPAANSNNHQDEDEGQRRQQHHHFHIPQQHNFKGIIPLLKQTIFLLTVVGILLMTSVGMYGIFYWFVMPPKFAREPLFFDYGGGGGVDRSVEEIAKEALMSHKLENECCWSGCCDIMGEEESCSGVTMNSKSKRNPSSSSSITAVATANLLVPYTQWTPCVPTATTAFKSKKTLPNRILPPNKPHFIDIALALPESLTNQNAGIFTIETSLHDVNGTTLAFSRRASMLPYTSTIVEILKKGVFLSLPYVLGVWREEKVVVVECLNHFVESLDQPLALVQVKISLPPPNPSFPSSSSSSNHHSTIQITSGEVRIGKELNFFQRLLKTWFLTCAFIGVSLLFGVQWISFWFVRFCWDEFWNLRREREEEEQRRRRREGNGNGVGGQEEGVFPSRTEGFYDNEDDDEFVPLDEPNLEEEEENEDDEDNSSKEDNEDNSDDSDYDDDDDKGGDGTAPSTNEGGSSENNDNDNNKNNESGGSSRDSGNGGGVGITKKNAPTPSRPKKRDRKRTGDRYGDTGVEETYNHQKMQMPLERGMDEEKKEDEYYHHYHNSKKTNTTSKQVSRTMDSNQFISHHQQQYWYGKENCEPKQSPSFSKKKKKKVKRKPSVTKVDEKQQEEIKKKEAFLADSVMKGHIGPYEIFTDLDDPDL